VIPHLLLFSEGFPLILFVKIPVFFIGRLKRKYPKQCEEINRELSTSDFFNDFSTVADGAIFPRLLELTNVGQDW